MIKCITFDLDDTLWKIEPVITKAEIFFQKWLDANYPEVSEKFNIESLRKLMKQIDDIFIPSIREIARSQKIQLN